MKSSILFTILASAVLVKRQGATRVEGLVLNPVNPAEAADYDADAFCDPDARLRGGVRIPEPLSSSSSSSSESASVSSSTTSSSISTESSVSSEESSSEVSSETTTESSVSSEESSSSSSELTESLSESSSSSSAALPLVEKRQATAPRGSYFINSGPCSAVGTQVGPFIGRVASIPFSGRALSISVVFGPGAIGCSPFETPLFIQCSATTTTRQTVTATSTASAAPAISVVVNQSTTVNLNVNIVISNCAVCGVRTVYQFSAFVCTNTVPVIFFGISYPCARVGAVNQITCPYVLTAGQVSTIRVAAAATAPIVPYVTTVIQGQTVSVPASTLPNVVPTTVVAPKPVVTFTGGANKLGMGAAAVIAGAAALL